MIPYSFVIPESEGTPRMGQLQTERGTVYSLAQWFPRVAVFDDVNGWNPMPYLGSGEFYLDYGDVDDDADGPREPHGRGDGRAPEPGRRLHPATSASGWRRPAPATRRSRS